MAKALHEITSGEFEDGLAAHFPRGREQPDEALPTQRWARNSELQHELWSYRPGALFLGYRNGKKVGRTDDRHIVLVAGSRAGKGVSVLTPNALLWPGSLLALDPKGELAKLTARHRARAAPDGHGQRVHVLNPFPTDADGLPPASFNPLAEIDPTHDTDVAEKAGLIADALIVHGGGDAHWSDAARQLVHGVLLYVITLPEAERHLVTVRHLLTLTDAATAPHPDADGLDVGLYELLAGCGGFDDDRLNDIVSGIGRSFLAKPTKERGSILSAAQVQTGFLDSPKLHDVLKTSSFRLRDLKRERTTIYLCLPASYMGTHGRWLRIIVNMALGAMEDQRIPKPDPPVLMMLDEFGTALGYMASIEKAAGLIAGYGVRLLTVLQDLTQLKHHYKETWETFIGNAGLFLAFGNSDATTLKYLSEKLGTLAVPVVTQNAQTVSSAMAGASGASTSLQTVPLLAPHEVEQAFTRERGRMLVLLPGMKPIVVQRSISHEDSNFANALGR